MLKTEKALHPSSGTETDLSIFHSIIRRPCICLNIISGDFKGAIHEIKIEKSYHFADISIFPWFSKQAGVLAWNSRLNTWSRCSSVTRQLEFAVSRVDLKHCQASNLHPLCYSRGQPWCLALLGSSLNQKPRHHGFVYYMKNVGKLHCSKPSRV